MPSAPAAEPTVPADPAVLAAGTAPADYGSAESAPPVPGAPSARPAAPSSLDAPARAEIGPPARDQLSAQLPPSPAADQSADRTQTQDGPGNSPPAARRRTGRPVASGRPAAGSIGDLLARLDRLPDGHPSSPYEDGGLAKPLPHRLRQLELGLPAPEREPVESGLLAGFGSPAIERTSPVVPSVASATDDASQTAEPPDGTYGALGPETGVRPEPRPDPRSAGDQGLAHRAGPVPPDDRLRRDQGWPDSPAPPRQANGHSGPDHRPAADALSLGPWPGAGPEAGAPAERRNGNDTRAPRAPAGGPATTRLTWSRECWPHTGLPRAGARAASTARAA